MSIEDEQCHVDFIPCKRGWRFYFTPQPRTNLCLSLVQGKLSNTNSLQLSFSTIMIFEHHVVSNWLILSNACQSKGSQKHIDDLWKTLQARLAILLLFMWLNLVNDTKLPTYFVKGSSYHVVQKLFFFFNDFLFCFLFLFFFIFF